MIFSINWLSEYIKLPEVSKLRKLIEQFSFEVEEVQEYGRNVDKKIVVAEVLGWSKHPNADKLRVVKLKTDKDEIEPVVCGATNFDKGDKVCFAYPGAIIPHDQHDPEGKPFKLTKAEIRGVESQGMICSASELGLGEDEDGILKLSKDASLGKPISEVLGDTLVDIDVQATNRGDVQSYIGIAREIAAITNSKLKEPKFKKNQLGKPKKVKVKIQNKKDCPRYTGALMDSVEVKSSPGFIVERLTKNGISPKNNVVDITNYVLLEYGLPVHAFDADKISSIVVRNSKKGEKILSLADEEEFELTEDLLLITDKGEDPIAVAGVVGGKNSSVTKKTTRVFIEAAKFDSVAVRSSSRFLGLRTEASAHFEKDPSVYMPPVVLSRVINLLQEYAGAELIEVSDVFPEEKKLGKEKTVSLSLDNVERLLGISLPTSQIKTLLSRTGFKVGKFDKTGITKVKVPYWRTDVNIQEDLIEEVGRLNDYGKIPEKPMKMMKELKVQQSKVTTHKEKIKDVMVAAGFTEARNYSFTSEKYIDIFGYEKEGLYEIVNPIDVNQRFLRPSLLPNLMETALRNYKKYNQAINYFEVGDVFNVLDEDNQKECVNLSAVAVADADPQRLLSLVKAALENVFKKLNLLNPEFKPHQVTPLTVSENTSASVTVGGQEVGSMGVVSPSFLDNFGTSNAYVAFFDLHNLEKILAETISEMGYRPPPKFPGSSVDISFVVDESVLWQQIQRSIDRVGNNTAGILTGVEVLDIYRDERKIGKDKKSLTIRLKFQHPERTLRDKEVKSAVSSIEDFLKQRFGAEKR